MRWTTISQQRLAVGVVVIGMLLSVIFTLNCLVVQQFYLEGFLSLPPTTGLALSVGLLRRPHFGFALAAFSAGLGILIMVYLKTRLLGTETGFLCYGATLGAALWGWSSSARSARV